jgi:hypothetical protein
MRHALLLIGIVCATPLAAQRPGLSSETGAYVEGYGISGRPARRPGSTVRFYAAPTFEWLGFSVGVNLLWSTEQSFTAQTVDRYSLNPRWSWGQVHAGDWVPVVSRYTASAVTVRGGGIELTPGRFRLIAAAGQGQQATDLSAFDAAPKRMLYAGLIGYGDREHTFLEVSGLRAVDAVAGADTLSAPPQENIVGALAGGAAFLGGRLRIKGDAAASLFSRDTRAGALDSLGQPGWTSSLFTPRVSSRIDYAWNADIRLGLRQGSVGLQIENVGPGFTTLGSPYLVNDMREVKVSSTLRWLKGRVNTTGAVGLRRDNLAGDKRGTTRRWTGTAAITALTGRWLVSSVSVMVNSITLDPTPLPPTAPDPGLVDSFRVSNLALSGVVTEQAQFKGWGVQQHLTISAALQKVEDQTPRFAGAAGADVHNFSLEWGVALRGGYSLAVRPGYQSFVGGGQSASYTSLGLQVSRRPPRSPLGMSLTSTLTQVERGWQLRDDMLVTWRLGDRDNLTVQLRRTDLTGVALPYHETLGTLRYSRRW